MPVDPKGVRSRTRGRFLLSSPSLSLPLRPRRDLELTQSLLAAEAPRRSADSVAAVISSGACEGETPGARFRSSRGSIRDRHRAPARDYHPASSVDDG